MKYLLGLLSIVFLASCNNDPEGNMELVFKGAWGENSLTMFETYNYAFDQQIQLTKSDFYISDVIVYDVGDIPTRILDVELVDLSFTDKASAEAGFEIPITNIEAVTYERIEFNIGLTQEQNAGRPEDYPSGDPLAAPRYWEPWTSYIFAKTEGLLDTLSGNGADLPWLYHTGTDSLAVRISAFANMTVPEDGTVRVEFTLDHRSLLGVPSDPIDIMSSPVNHNPQNKEQIARITQSYASSLSLRVD